MTDKTELEATQAMYAIANQACVALGINPGEVIDPIGPVTKLEHVLYAMYKHQENVEAQRDILATRTPDPTPAVPADGLVEAAEMARVILMGVRPGLCMKPGGKVVSAGQALDALEAALAAHRGEA